MARDAGDQRSVAHADLHVDDGARLQLKLPGEDVQLPVYALLAGEHATEAAYLSFDQDQVHAVKPDGDIQELAQQVAARLRTLFEELHAGAGLPAHGAEQVCDQCEMEGLCRRSYRMSRNANG